MFGKFFDKLKEGLTKTRDNFTDKVTEVLNLAVKIDDDMYEELEEALITSDLGVETTLDVIEKLKVKIKEEKVKDPAEVKPCLKQVLKEILQEREVGEEKFPKIILVIGVNGVGKTTSIGKIAHRYKENGKKVLLAAADTFRAAAIDQLEVWSNRVGVDIIKHQEGADPGAVVFDSIQASRARNVDVLICDTAGRLHNKKNLMDELGKINRIIEREFGTENVETLLVLDGTTGQNAVQQAKQFKEVCNLNGIILTKLDGTAKGGIVISIKNSLNIPVKYIGVGEGMEDLQKFKADEFVEALL
ncbi:signal recognition particle-docking protein FtsY [Hathewaya histolytica]|uniref:Signal recognition particle receptor FtsY n=1 Tax=Hathewaya histolytica TaxID=1498 RepID=A0A4U9REA0_HATHI|nr:signal recognition particle-docking protein FtsY [Hathewaya histolytica]VTQ90009.1 signal recognition particle-docking protein FtsY [Hathewaya histolytica]